MNNSIIIKNADFSSAKIDKLNLQKLTVTKDGAGYCDSVGGVKSIVNSGAWNPQNELCYSTEIALPVGIKALFGMSNKIMTSSDFDNWIANPNNANLYGYVPFWCFHRTSTDKWSAIKANSYSGKENRPNIIKYKQNLYTGGDYTALVFEGPIYGTPFAYNDIDKMVINWIVPTSAQAPEIGLLLPEVYAYVE